MATRIRTLNFLPEVFQTTTNAQFLGATLDQIVDQPNTMPIEGYVGSKFGYGINARDKYVIEPTKVRTDYQLDPGVVFTKTNTAQAANFVSYPGIVDSISLEGGIKTNNDRLFNSQFYSWDPFVDLDKLINFNQYYWLPEGAPAVNITAGTVYNATNYVIDDLPNGYNISSDVNPTGTTNPVLTLIRGGTYSFSVSQTSSFWIQGKPGLTGYDPQQPNVQTRDILGVTNNGISDGTITFSVPFKDAQSEYNFPGNNLVDVVSTTAFSQINGQLMSTIGDIDGVTSLDGLTVMFYDTGEVPLPGDINDVTANFFTATYTGSESDPTVYFYPTSSIPSNQKITANYGTEWKARSFYRNTEGTVTIIPYLSSILDTMYYQDGTIADKVGIIKLIDSNITNQIDVDADIIGKSNYTSPNGVAFTNGLKVTFSGDVIPTSYASSEYYVQGVGVAISLIDTTNLVVSSLFTEGSYSPYDVLSYDIGNFDGTLFVPVQQDYMTIARDSIDRNPWSRSNRWFHVDVINSTASYLNDPTIATTYATKENKARRPIIEFYPNLKLFNSGIVGKQPIDFFDTRTTDAFKYVAGQENYYPDVEVYTAHTANIASVTAGTTTTITVPASDVSGTFAVGQYVTDTADVLPRNTQVTAITGTTTLTLTVEWTFATNIATTTDVSLVADQLSNDDYALYDGAKIVFSADTNPEVRNKIYIVHLPTVGGVGSVPVITLTEVADGLVLPFEGVFAFKGYYNQGNDFYFDGLDWKESQQKITVNQAPLFDVLDATDISFGDNDVYTGTSFKGNKLFAYGVGSGINDIVLGFPLRYSSVNNVGDISFDVTFNESTFSYVNGTTPVEQKVNTGYVFNVNFNDGVIDYTKQLGWQTAVAPSRQYQILSFDFFADNPTSTFVCDIAALSVTDTIWPNIQLYVNNELQDSSTYTYVVTSNSTVVTFEVPNPSIDTIIEITILSDQVSKSGYYEVPINLSNNPFNQDVTTVNVGDIRGQYQSIFYNNPNTTGQVFGANNYRDLGNLVPWGNKIIQNSASLVLPGTFLRQQNHNLFNSLQYNSQQYVTFKNLLVNTVNSTDYTYYQTPAVMLDDALDQITSAKVNTGPFFWSDMLPSKAAYVVNTYTFANSLDSSIYPLSRIYDFSKANYYGILVYLTRTINNNPVVTQLVKGQDYTVSEDSPSLTVTLNLLSGDIITINEYNQTFGSYIPNTPTKLGLYPSWIPSVVSEISSVTNQTTNFIVGHDGSYTKLYGDYIDGQLIDFRDKVLFEFENRIYNNLKLSDIIPIRDYDVIPGFFRDTGYSYSEILEIYSQNFLNWVGQNRIEFKEQLYVAGNQWTYNYSQSSNNVNGEQILQGNWRGIYQYMYDTAYPDTAPWQMLGFTDQPSWWTAHYGAAPYTSDNLILWEDLAQGINWNNGNPIIVPQCIRPQLLEVIPVDSSGNLRSPLVNVIGKYSTPTFKHDWKVGDVAPAEFSYRRSSTWPFDLMKLMALTKPANFFNLGVDVDNYKYSTEFNQFLVNNRSHLIISDVEIYGSGTAKTSYINWIVDYEKQQGVDATQSITDLLDNLDVRLVYRLAGFSDKTLLNFYVEKGTPNSKNASLLIPNESYSVLLYDNVPFTQIAFSGVIVQSTANGWKVFGNSQSDTYFTALVPKINGNFSNVTVEKLSVQVANDYKETETVLVAYGTEFRALQDLAQFINSYGRYLATQGVLFDQIESGLDVNWNQMTAELLYWAQSGWEVGSIINLNPGANGVSINKDSYIVQPLTLQKQNFILNQNLYPIQSVDLSVVRDGTLFTAVPLNEGDTVAYGQFNISNFEHGIVFDNVTLFNDTIYSLVTGLRQNRILCRGVKTAEWNGTIDAQGFILNQDNIVEWNPTVKYTKGSIVLYKNQYWAALKVLDPAAVFDPSNWKRTDINEIQKGLLPNSSTRSYESTLFYDTNKANLDKDADLLSWSLIGYRPRDYLALADLTDITQVNVYKNMVKSKGTRLAANAFKGLTLPQGGIDYDIYENWAIKTGEFGGVLNNNFVDFKLNQNMLTGNPAIVGLTTGDFTDGVEQEVPLYALFNYERPITNPNVLPTLPADVPSMLLPTAGYVNFNDVKTYAYYYDGLNSSIVPISNVYVGEFVWLADYQGTWQIFTPISLGTITGAVNNLNGTATVQFSQPHGLSKYQPFAVVNFNTNIDGYRIVANVVDAFRVTITVALPPSLTSVTGLGIGMQFVSHKVDTPSDINQLDLLNTEFVKNRAWVDTGADGGWAVYQKSINYAYNSAIEHDGSQSFGSAVAYTPTLGYLLSDADKGEVYRYSFNGVFNRYDIVQNLRPVIAAGSFVISNVYEITFLGDTDWAAIGCSTTPAVGVTFTATGVGSGTGIAEWIDASSYGSTITYTDNVFVISKPTGTPKVYVYELVTTALVNSLVLTQEIAAPGGVTNWGTSTAISSDKNWLYISAYVENQVYVYRKSQVTGLYEQVNTVTIAGLVSYDNFGFSIATNYYGTQLYIGAPGQASSVGESNYGFAYVFDRLTQLFETPYTSNLYVPLAIPLAVTIGTITKTTTTFTGNAFTLSNTTNLVVDMPIVFTGTLFGGVSAYVIYYIKTIVGSTITISLSRGGATFTLSGTTGSMNVVAQSTPIFVSVNGTLVADNTYAVVGSVLNVYGSINVGSIISISTSQMVEVQKLSSNVATNMQAHFGYSVASDSYGNELLIGAPQEITDSNEGMIHRFTNSGSSYGLITATSACAISSDTAILVNGFSVTLSTGYTASDVATAINGASISNIIASSANNLLVISVVNSDIALINNKLTLSVIDYAVWAQLGINLYTETQTIACPNLGARTQFGSVIKFNEAGSFVASAPVGSRFAETTFDMTDDENYTNDTLFDNNATQFVDQALNAGAVYMFDYLSVYNESLINTGSFVYAQSLNALSQDYGAQPYYGTAIDFNSNYVVIGTQNFMPNEVNGQVIVYNNASGQQDWSVYRNSSPIVDTAAIQNVQIYSAITNNTLENLDYIDPLQGKILGSVRENIDIISNNDPASYNSPNATNNGRVVWGSAQLGKLWFNTSTVRFVNYHQNNEVVYNSKWWGKVFPGSDVQVYSWIVSDVAPFDYAGVGTPLSLTDYTVEFTQSSTGAINPVYCYWVRNTNIVFTKAGKTLSDTICESYIAQPQATGIAYMAAIQPNVFGLYNCVDAINQTDAVMHIGFATGTSDDVSHSVYSLIRENYADDFLPGLPGTAGVLVPESLYNRMLESLSGVDESGSIVPDPYLPKAVQSGILVRPRQSFFYNRFNALKNYLQYVNEVILQIPVVETTQATFLYQTGAINPTTGEPFFDTAQYWDYVNWWAEGYSDNTKPSLLVQSYYDLAYINAQEGLIVTVNKNGAGVQETYIYLAGEWVRIGLQYGTLQFKSSLWDYSEARIGFGDNFFDTSPFDTYPSEETKYIIRALNEELPSDLDLFRNKALILLFNYIISETIESQNFIPWLNKTSFIDVSHTIRELLPLKVFQSDNQDFLSGYLNEIKPYHVVIKDFLFKYTGIDVYEGDITDFDVPAVYNTALQQYISPQLVYSNPNGTDEYLPSASVWQQVQYTDWFNNFGLSLTGSLNYNISKLESYVALNSNSMVVNNIYGFPINGVITVGSEDIGYSDADIATGILSGLTRGVNGTTVTNHIPGEEIFINLTPVVVLDSGRGYINPPKVTAYVDTSIYPAPRRPAILKPVMNLDAVLRIDVIDPGSGYVVLPEIQIEPSIVITFNSTDVNIGYNTVDIANQFLQLGDLVQYVVGADSTTIGGLVDGQFYYINVLQTSPAYEIAFYTTYADALQDTHRVVIYDAGTGSNQTLLVSARAIAVTSSAPVRENQITLRFDRTSYTSQVEDWRPAGFYGSFFAGLFNNSTQISSSAIKLASTGNNEQAPITAVIASAQGIAFEIQDVTNDRVISWSSRTRDVLSTVAPAGPNNISKVVITNSVGGMEVTSVLGPTTGFYSTMPIQFAGQAFGNLAVDTVYYVAYIFDLTSFAISTATHDTAAANLVTDTKYVITTVGSTDWVALGASANTLGIVFTKNGVTGTGTGTAYSVVQLTSTSAPVSGVSAIIGEVTDTAIVTIQYPNILTATETTAVTNAITVPLTPSGIGGTHGFYEGIPVFFISTTFGNIVENDIYYVTAILDSQNFTMSKSTTLNRLSVYSATSSVLNMELVDSLNVNDQFVINNITLDDGSGNPEPSTMFAGLIQNTIYYVQSKPSATSITVTDSFNGAPLLLTAEPALPGTSATYVDLSDNLDLTTATGSVTLNVGLPVSPGQITGQNFTFYQTSGEFTNSGSGITGTTSSVIVRNVIASVAVSNRLYVNINGGGITNFYVNMPFVVDTPGHVDFGGLTANTPYEVTAFDFTSTEVTSSSSTTDYFTCAATTGFYSGMQIKFSGSTFGNVDPTFVYYVKTVVDGFTFSISTTSGGATLDLATDSGSMTVTSVSPYIIPNATLSNATSSVVVLTQAPEGSTYNPGTLPSFFVGYVLGGYTVQINYAGVGYAVDNTITIQGGLIGGTNGVNDLTITVSEIDSTGGITNTINSGTPTGVTESYYLKVISETQCEVYSNSLLTTAVSGIDFPFSGVKSTSVIDSSASANTITISDSTGFAQHDPVVFTGNVLGGLVLGQVYYIKTVIVPGVTTVIQVTTTPNSSAAAVDITLDNMSFTMAKSGDYTFLAEPFYFTQSIVKYQNKVWQCVVSNNDNEFILGKWELLSSDDRRLNELDRIIGYYQPTVNMPGLDLTQLVDGITYPNSTYLDNAFPPAEEFELDTYLQDQPFYPANVNAQSVSWNGTRYYGIVNGTDFTAVISSVDNLSWATNIISDEPVGATDIQYGNGLYVITAANNATPIYVSADGITFTTGTNVVIDNNLVYVESTSLNSVAYSNTAWAAVGNNIVRSKDGYNWLQTYPSNEFEVMNGIAYINSANFVGFIVTGYKLTSSVSQGYVLISVDDGATWQPPQVISSYSLNSSAGNNSTLVIVGDNGVVYTSSNGVNWSPRTSGVTENLRDIAFGQGKFIAIGDAGTILVSSNNGVTWTASNPVSTDLNGITYDYTNNDFVIVGDESTTLSSVDGSSWTEVKIYSIPPTVYDVQGDAFTAGYGPEELVPGLISDSLTMVVKTRAGTNWDATIYGHTGFNVVSLELTPLTGQLNFSFNDLVQNAANISVYDVDSATGLSVRLYETTVYPDYTVNWVSQIVTLTYPLVAGHVLRIDAYEVGNGYQLVKSSSLHTPFVTSRITGFTEIMLDCAYSASIYEGSGVIDSATGTVWTAPFIMHNGTNLELGSFEGVTATLASTNRIVCDSTAGFTAGDKITFSDSMFGGVTPHFEYTILVVVGDTTFIVEDPGNPGNALPLTNASGTAYCVSKDYAITLAGSTALAMIVFATQYSASTDYVAFSLFGETTPAQYGFTLPQVQLITSTGSSSYPLTIFVGDDNPVNDIVEVDGLRQEPSTYTINDITNTITFVSAPTAGQRIAVTGYNLTDRQYLSTQAIDITTANTVDAISSISSTIVPPLVTASITAYNSAGNVLTAVTTSGFLVDASIQFYGAYGSLSNVETSTGKVYYVKTISLDGVSFTISETQGGSTFAITGSGSAIGSVVAVVGGQPAVRVTTDIANGFQTNDIVRIAGTSGSVQLNNQVYYVHVISDTKFDLYLTTYNASVAASNSPVTAISSYNGGGYVWIDESFIIDSVDWEQTDVDRLWVTVNGYRVASSSLVLSAGNNLGILTPMNYGDKLVITSMIPTATPDELTYLQFVNKSNTPAVYRANSQTTTWIVAPASYSSSLPYSVEYTDATIYVQDVSKVTNLSVTTANAPAAVNGVITMSVLVDKNAVSQVIVYNNVTQQTLPESAFSFTTLNSAPVVKITSGVAVGQSVTITVVLGNLLYVNGEAIRFTKVNFTENSISGLQRGVNGTSPSRFIPMNSIVYGLLPTDKLADEYYGLVWNTPLADSYNTTLGDPLQISTTPAAIFLNSDVS